MKAVALLIIVSMAVLGMPGTVLAYEGATKVAAAMNMPRLQPAAIAPLKVASNDQPTYGKLVTKFLLRMPKPTLSASRIRKEIPGRTSGTKAVVLFQQVP